MESKCSVPRSQQPTKFQALKYGDVMLDCASHKRDVRLFQPQTRTTTCTSRLSRTAHSALTAADKCLGSQLKTAMSGSQGTQWARGHAMVEDAPYGNNRPPTGHASWQGTKNLGMHHVTVTQHSVKMELRHVLKMKDWLQVRYTAPWVQWTWWHHLTCLTNMEMCHAMVTGDSVSMVVPTVIVIRDWQHMQREKSSLKHSYSEEKRG